MISWTAALLLALAASPVSADQLAPLFSKEYARAAGPPVVMADTFSACDPGGTFRLVVLNGPGHHDRVSSGSVVVNGMEVIHERDFYQRASKIERRLKNIARDNSLEVRLRSKPGGAIKVSVEGRQTCGPRITTPASGSRLTVPVVVVQGTVPTPPATNVGVTVNGVPAFVEAGRFAAVVPVAPEVTSLTATATDPSGAIGSDTVSVSVQLSAPDPRLRLDVSPAGGAAPLTVGFSLASLVPVLTLALDVDGDGVVDFEGENLEGRTFTYPQPGIYTAMVQVTDDVGLAHTGAALVHVSDPTGLDARLQAVWQGLKDALRVRDLVGAGAYIHSEARAAYADQFNRFGPTTLANIDAHMTTIQLVQIGPGGAQYEMLRDRDGQTVSFAVWFQLDQDGLWRLRRF